ncbi:FBX41 protein, partial [Sitta europaea]|nr:FBX41 protein [Sitta europaea]
EIVSRGKAVAPAPAPPAAMDAAYEEGLARLKIRAFEKLEVDKRLEKLTEEVEQKIASQVGRLQVELDRKSSELEKAKQESLRLSREKQELEDRASELSRQVDVSVEMLASLKQDLVQKEQELTRKQQELRTRAGMSLEQGLETARQGVQGQVWCPGVHSRALRSGGCDQVPKARGIQPQCPAWPWHCQGSAALGTCARAAHPPHAACPGELRVPGTIQVSSSVPGTVQVSSSVPGTIQVSSSTPEPAPHRHSGTRAPSGAGWGDPGERVGRSRVSPRSPCQGGAADRPVPEGDGGSRGQRQGWGRWKLWHRDGASLTRCSRPAPVATDAGCPTARPEGAGGKVCRLERGSPGHSSEVISPEILKMRAALFCIFTYLDTRTLLRAAEVCKDWKFVARHPAVWTRVLLENARVSSKFLAMLSQWCTQMHSLTLQNLKPRQRGKKESKEDYMKSTRGCLEAGLESLLKATGSNLLILRISHCPNVLTDRSLWLASCYCRALQAVTYRSSTDPVGHEVIWALGAGCRDIISLQVAPLHPWCSLGVSLEKPTTPRPLGAPPALPPARGCPGGAEGALCAAARNCMRLQVLELDHVAEINQEVAAEVCREGLKGLEMLVLTSTPVTPKALLHFNSVCRNLKSIVVQVGIVDYFKEPHSPEARKMFEEMVNKLQALRKRPGFSKILHIKVEGGC